MLSNPGNAPDAKKAGQRSDPLDEGIVSLSTYRTMLLENRVEEVAGLVRARKSDMNALASLLSDPNSVVMVRAAEAIKRAAGRAPEHIPI